MVLVFLLLFVGLILLLIQIMYLLFLNFLGKEFVGLLNYLWIFMQFDGIIVVVNMIIWVLLVLMVLMIVGFVYVVFIDCICGEKIYKVFVFMLMVIFFVGVSIIWWFVYEYCGLEFEQIGLLNQILVWFGGILQQWLLNQLWNNLFFIVVFIWVQIGFVMVVLFVFIKGVLVEFLEVVEFDGVNVWQWFILVIVLVICLVFIVVLIMILIVLFKVFDIVCIMIVGNYGILVLVNEMYMQFLKFEVGCSVVFFVILFILVLLIVIYNVCQIKKQWEI